jgi:hypothetical protein
MPADSKMLFGYRKAPSDEFQFKKGEGLQDYVHLQACFCGLTEFCATFSHNVPQEQMLMHPSQRQHEVLG